MADKLDTIPVTEDEETSMKTMQKPIVQNNSMVNGSTDIRINKSVKDADEYDIHSGSVVVINNINFDPKLQLPERTGSDVDASCLFQRFQELDFDCDLLNDATYAEIKEKFDEIKEDTETLKKTDCLIVAVLSHGNEEAIFSTDQEIKIKTLMDHFNAENCKELALKPKIFIFQACRGSDVGSGITARVIRDPNQSDAKSETQEYDQNFGEVIRIPNEADFLAVYSSSSGYGSFRNTEKGSPFVRILSEELRNMKKGDDFYKILTRVNRKVGTEYKPKFSAPKIVTQMPCFISHLTKTVILKQ